ncbi:SusC/RagA family TonB-linked outer membrane protein [Marinilabilia sp.]|uniref:STN domain-containing protein n=1 Tax=Marinilabilia sp. TaxID=2021252 RepID=UPI0025B8F84A|nr:SusC/RagA family TonB-linked outer membrane protein [Marinilabilia sp.]
MKMSAMFLFVAIFTASANNSFSQVGKVSIHLENVKLSKAFDAIESQTSYSLFYKKDVVDDERIISISVDNYDVDIVLNQLLEGENVSYKVIDESIVIVPRYLNSDLSQQQEISVRGQVADENGDPVPGVSVVVDGTMNGTITDVDGNYVLENVPENAILNYSFVGMLQQSIEVRGRNRIDVVMEQTSIGLDEVVAIGYGVMRKSDMTGATSRLTEDEMNKSVASSPAEMMQGRVPGVNFSRITVSLVPECQSG